MRFSLACKSIYGILGGENALGLNPKDQEQLLKRFDGEYPATFSASTVVNSTAEKAGESADFQPVPADSVPTNLSAPGTICPSRIFKQR